MLQGRISRRLARTTGLATLLAAVGCAVGGTAAHAAYPGPEGRIVFSDRANDVRVVTRDGRLPRTVVPHGWYPEGFSTSPDGRRIAVAQNESCDQCSYIETRLGIVSADGGPVTVLYHDKDDRSIAADVREPTWSPDGKRIVFSAEDQQGDGERGLWVLDVDGGAPRRLGPFPTVERIRQPAWSPDGSRIAFTAITAVGERERVFVAPAEGGAATQLTSGGYDQSGPTWSPDGTEIAYVHRPLDEDSRIGDGELAKRRAAGGGQEILYRSPGSVVHPPAWSPDGARIAFVVEDGDPDLAKCAGEVRTTDAEDGGRGTRVICNPWSEPKFVDWGPRIARGDTRLVTAAQGSATQGADGTLGDLALARNGRYAVFSSRATDLTGAPDTNGKSDVFRRDLVSGEVELVSSGAAGGAADGDSDRPVASADGRWVAFRSTARDLIAGFAGGGHSAVYLRDMENGRTTLVSRHYDAAKRANERDADPVAVSDDGRAVLFGSDARDLVPHLGEDDGDEHRNLYRHDRGTGINLPVDARAGGPLFEGNGEALAARMTPDGRYVAFESRSTDLIAGFEDRNGGAASVFVRDTTANVTRLVDGHAGSARETTSDASARPTRLQGLSHDGGVVLFSSAAPDVLGGFDDLNGLERADVYRRDLAEPHAALVSYFTRTWTRGAEGDTGAAALSADGRTVAFTADDTLANASKDPNGDGLDVWQRRFPQASPEDELPVLLTAGGEAATPGNAASDLVALSADGRQALIASTATDLTYPLAIQGGHAALYRVNLLNHETHAVTERADLGPDAAVTAGALSGGGQVALYATGASNLLDGFSDRNAGSADGFAWTAPPTSGEDEIAPDVEIEAPVDGGIYRANRFYEADYGCRDFGGSGLKQCQGTVNAGEPFDTETPGEKTFTVTATDGAGNTTTRTIDYRVVPVNHQLTLASRAAGTQTNGANGDSTAGPIAGEYALLESAATDLGATGAVFRRNLVSGALVPVAAEGHALGMSADGRFVLLRTAEQLLVRDLQAGTTTRVAAAAAAAISRDGRTVAFRSEEGTDPAKHGTYSYDVATGERARVGGGEPVAVENGHVLHTDGEQLRLDDKLIGTGTDARLSADGTVVAYLREGAVYRNDQRVAEATAFRLSGDGRTVAYEAGGDVKVAGTTIEDATLHGLSDDGRFLLYMDAHGDVWRRDLVKDRTSHVASGATAPFEHVALSADGRRAILSTAARAMIDDFVDGNGPQGADVFTWFDVPPVPNADAKLTGPLTLAFDGALTSDSDGRIVEFRWEWGDGRTTVGEPKLAHTYPDDGTYDVKLIVTDDGSNEVTFAFEVIAIKGVLTANRTPLDFLGVDKTLRCSVVREIPLYADTGGACGTFVALGGTVYGPAGVLDGTTAFTPVSQVASSDGGVAQLVTTVALGSTGVKVRQTDTYHAGRGWYRTDTALVNDGATARTATIYRAAVCAIGPEGERRALHDAGTGMAACEGALATGRTLAALLPLDPGARHESGAGLFARVAAGAELTNACACDDAVPGHGMAIAWPVTAPAQGEATRASAGAFGPDGVIPLTVALAPEKAQVQPLDDNAFVLTVRNPNASALPVGAVAVDSDGVWDYTPGTSSGLSTQNPATDGGVHTWVGPFTVAGHGSGEQRFAVTHRNGTRIAVSTASATHDVTQFVGFADGQASVDVQPIEGSIPNTAIYGGPTGLGTNPEPRFQLVASKDEGVSYECRFAPGTWEPCDSDHRPGPLADGAYALEVRATDQFGTDPTPATRAFAIDTLAPNTVIASGPAKLTTDTRPVFRLTSNEPGATFECRFGDAAFAPCAATLTAPDLADGEHRFQARAKDRAGNVDETPATWTFRVDTTAPWTVISAIDGKGVKAVRPGAPPSTAATGASLTLGADGSAGLKVACPVDNGGPCDGTVGLAMASAGAARAGASIPSNAVQLTRETFSAAPGETVTVRLTLPMSTRNQVDRIGRVAVFATVQLGRDEAVRGDDLLLKPDPRTVRLLDAGREIKTPKLRLLCPKGHAGACRGTVNQTKFTIKAGRTKKVSVKAKRGAQLAVLVKTRAKGGTVAKRLTVTLRAKEARR